MPTVTPVAVGFAEFISTLISETLDAVTASMTEQEERRVAMLEAANMDVESFAVGHVGDEEVQALEGELFGDGDGTTTITVGSKPPPKEDLAALGIELGRRDVVRGALSRSGVATIRTGLRRHIAGRRLDALGEVISQGVPQIVVDEGKIVARVTFEVLNIEADEEEGGDAAAVQPSASRVRVGLVNPLVARSLPGRALAVTSARPFQPATSLAQLIPLATQNLRLRVRPASPDEAPETSGSTSVYGDIELTFRTVF